MGRGRSTAPTFLGRQTLMPSSPMRAVNNLDWSPWDLESLPEAVIPRTNYQRACSRERYDAESPHWDGRPAADQYRLIHRRFVGTGGVRTLQACVIPPGPLSRECESLPCSE